MTEKKTGKAKFGKLLPASLWTAVAITAGVYLYLIFVGGPAIVETMVNQMF